MQLEETTMTKISLSLYTLTIYLTSLSLQAQQCNTSEIISSNNTEQFVVNSQQGTAIDARTGLEWSLCSVGQTWQNNNCVGTPTNFADYAAAAKLVKNSDSVEGYRIPNIKELGSIVERSCTSPAIDLSLFPDSLNAIYYSSTPDNQSNQHFSPALGVKVIDFTDGSEFVPDVSKYRYLRLVRNMSH